MGKVTATLSIGVTFRNPEAIAEVEALSKQLNNTTWTQSDIYLTGLRTVISMIHKAKKAGQ